MRNIFISGADRGLGLELTKIFLEKGNTVFAGKYLKKWDDLESLKEQYGSLLNVIELDVANAESVANAVSEVKAKTNSIDILINNAAILGKLEGTIFEDLDYDDMIHVFKVNAIGPLRLINSMIDLVLNSFQKLIVNISSEAGSINECWRYEGFGYCMSKTALNMASAIIHNSLHRKYNGQVMLIHPGGMSSFMSISTASDSEKTSEYPEKRFITPDISAEGIYNLITDQERFKSLHPAFVNYRGDKLTW